MATSAMSRAGALMRHATEHHGWDFERFDDLVEQAYYPAREATDAGSLALAKSRREQGLSYDALDWERFGRLLAAALAAEDARDA